jgi:hypothetical protein
MRPCASCTSQGVLCVLSSLDERCEQCYRYQRQCDLASPWAEDDRLEKKEKELREQALEAERRGDAARERALSAFASAREEALAAEAKAARLRKQARLL